MVVPPGYGVGDFIAVGQLAWKVYKACKGAPGEFQELSRELSSLHIILAELEDDAKTPTSLLNRRGASRKAELDGTLKNISVVLEQVEDIADRYASLGRDQRKAWERMRFAGENLADLRSKLSLHINAINLFVASSSAGSLARIEGVLDDLIRDIKSGKKEPSVVSAHEDTDEAAWTELERELIGDGITKQDIEKHKDDIKDSLKRLVMENPVDVDSDGGDSLDSSLDDLELDGDYPPWKLVEAGSGARERLRYPDDREQSVANQENITSKANMHEANSYWNGLPAYPMVARNAIPAPRCTAFVEMPPIPTYQDTTTVYKNSRQAPSSSYPIPQFTSVPRLPPRASVDSLAELGGEECRNYGLPDGFKPRHFKGLFTVSMISDQPILMIHWAINRTLRKFYSAPRILQIPAGFKVWYDQNAISDFFFQDSNSQDTSYSFTWDLF